MFKKFFSWLFGTKSSNVELEQIKKDIEQLRNTKLSNLIEKPESQIIPPNQEILKLKVDDIRMQNVEKSLTNLSIILHKVIEEQKKTQDFIVQLSTLHEELLNALDQNNVAFVKIKREQNIDEEIDAIMRQEEPILPKKDLN